VIDFLVVELGLKLVAFVILAVELRTVEKGTVSLKVMDLNDDDLNVANVRDDDLTNLLKESVDNF
jgi:hypothetical protein